MQQTNETNIFSQIGNTPLVEAKNLCPNPNIKLLLKLEGNNPGGSVKDRAAYNMISQAIERGDITKNTRLVEPTSGNTGIALAFIAKLFGISISLVMPENSTVERVKTMQAFGAEVILTPSDVGIEGARDHAFKMRDEQGYVLLNQFENDDNWQAHYKTTGPEIWRDTKGEVTHFVSAMGTTGTVMGTSTFLKEKNSDIVITGAQPEDGASIPGIRKWSPDYTPTFFDKNKLDNVIEVNEQEAKSMTHRLALEEGIFAGMSSGGCVAVALKLIEQIDHGVVVAIVCDRGDRYLSSSLFDK